jgi:hypothetical protein
VEASLPWDFLSKDLKVEAVSYFHELSEIGMKG